MTEVKCPYCGSELVLTRDNRCYCPKCGNCFLLITVFMDTTTVTVESAYQLCSIGIPIDTSTYSGDC